MDAIGEKMNTESRTVNSSRNIVTGIVAQFIQLIFSWICRMVFVYCLTEAYLGVNGLFSNILSVLSLAEMGIGSAIVFELYHALAVKDEIEIAALMQFYKKAYMVIGLLILGSGIVISPFVGMLVTLEEGITENIYILYFLYLINSSFSYFFSYKSSIIIADQKNYIVTLTTVCITILQNFLQIVLLLVTKNFLLYLICQVCCTLFYNVVISLLADRYYPIICKKQVIPISLERQKNLFKNIRALVIVRVSATLVNSTDNIIITALNGLSVTGITSNYTLITSTISNFTTKITEGITASVGNLNAIEGKEKRLDAFNAIYLMNDWIFGWCSICFILLSSEIVQICFGDKYLLPLEVVIVMGINFYLVGMQGTVNVFKNTLGLFVYGKYMALFTGIVNVIFSVWLGKIWGVLGVLVATFISKLLSTVWYFPYVVFKHGFHMNPLIFYRKYLISWVEIILIFCITYICCSMVDNSPIINVLYYSMVCLILPNSIMWMIHRREKAFSFLLQRAGDLKGYYLRSQKNYRGR